MNILLLLILNQAEDSGIIRNVRLESLCILFCHPAAENVKWFLWLIIHIPVCCIVITMSAGCQFTDIEVPGKLGKCLLGRNNVRSIFLKECFSGCFVCIQICCVFLIISLECCICILGCSGILVRNVNLLKMHSRICCMDSLCLMGWNKINSPDITLIFITFDKDSIQIVINISFEFLEIVFLNPSDNGYISFSGSMAYQSLHFGTDR